ncbi:MAG: diguanylate cyclase [Thiohalocapsa sp.]|uniref:diguanylate cyclase n=1 Tax=Thiohalocapsa sp. TaxID=2497641 RepID=UPI0025FBC88D|nr:diguanylate cyclase [Thiohalocapsa sp.]MCG6942233.1 diguanylate cyclase [Thiohalocapsa sp.]
MAEPGPPKVLVVDDNETNLDILLGLLADYDVIVALDGHSALDLLRQETPDVILLDIVMPGMDGYEVCARIKADAGLRDIPILFITAKTDEASLVRAFDIGGSDYVTKPFRSRELLARVRIQVQYRRAMEQLRHIAVTDELTGVRNRRAFFERAGRLFADARAHDRALSALMLDIDHFKQINDTHGHAIGDIALKHFAAAVQTRLPRTHLFGRLGGEEFALLAPGTDADEAADLAEHLRATVHALRVEEAVADLRLTVSIGLAALSEGALNLDDLLRRADDRLYEAKRSGRNRVWWLRRIGN